MWPRTMVPRSSKPSYKVAKRNLEANKKGTFWVPFFYSSVSFRPLLIEFLASILSARCVSFLVILLGSAPWLRLNGRFPQYSNPTDLEPFLVLLMATTLTSMAKWFFQIITSFLMGDHDDQSGSVCITEFLEDTIVFLSVFKIWQFYDIFDVMTVPVVVTFHDQCKVIFSNQLAHRYLPSIQDI